MKMAIAFPEDAPILLNKKISSVSACATVLYVKKIPRHIRRKTKATASCSFLALLMAHRIMLAAYERPLPKR